MVEAGDRLHQYFHSLTPNFFCGQNTDKALCMGALAMQHILDKTL